MNNTSTSGGLNVHSSVMHSAYHIALPAFLLMAMVFSDLIDHLKRIRWVHIYLDIKFACYIFDYYSLFGIVKFLNLYKCSSLVSQLTWYYLLALTLLILLIFCNIIYQSGFYIFTKDRQWGISRGNIAKIIVL